MSPVLSSPLRVARRLAKVQHHADCTRHRRTGIVQEHTIKGVVTHSLASATAGDLTILPEALGNSGFGNR
jgi:hypothetical protein